jgi:acyl-CoA thioester hydrolase
MSNKLNLTTLKLENYPLNSFDKIRYCDTDKQGHVNSTGFAAFCETGRSDILFQPDSFAAAEGRTFVIASLNLNFIAEINWPGTVEIGTGILQINKSSILLGQSIFQNGKLCATSETIMVQVSGTPAKSCSLSAIGKEFLSQYLL